LVVALALASISNPLGAAVCSAIVLFVLAASGQYRPRITVSLGEDVPRVLGGVVVPLVLILIFGVASVPEDRLLASIPGIVAAVLVGRIVTAVVVRAMRTRRWFADPTLIVGAGHLGVEIAGILREHPEYGLAPVGFLDDAHSRLLPLPMLGGLADLDAVLTEHGITRVIVTFDSMREPDIVPILRARDRCDVEVYVVPRLFELGLPPSGSSFEFLWGISLFRVRRAAITVPARCTKRCFDLIVSAGALVLAMPLFGIIAIAVRCGSPGPVFFRQRRIGQGGKAFDILKFRTLHVNTDSDITWSVAGDPRVTRVGAFLRRTSLDELPQLVNVLKGNMSLVGPRPERPAFVDQFVVSYPQYFNRHRVDPGMTGWAQVHGLRGDTSIADRVRFDNYYIEQWSLWTDVTILVRSVWAVVSGIRNRSRGPDGQASVGFAMNACRSSPFMTDPMDETPMRGTATLVDLAEAELPG
jgi:exopolysaccharide biosynthesis polyprenyl glycosylphosphotransferase